MKTQDKELLIKDLCGRLPYGVKVQVNKVGERDGETKRFVVSKELTFDDVKSFAENGTVSDIKPYLRLMSSVTEEEYDHVYDGHINFWNRCDYCNSHHFDYRGLIPMGLALPAPEGMYDFK